MTTDGRQQQTASSKTVSPPNADGSVERKSPKPRNPLRAIAGLIAAVGLFHGAAGTFIIGAIVTTGCLMECSTPDPARGTLILLSSVALTTLALVALWWGFFNSHWKRVWVTLGILSAGLTGGVVYLVGSAV